MAQFISNGIVHLATYIPEELYTWIKGRSVEKDRSISKITKDILLDVYNAEQKKITKGEGNGK